MDSLLPQVMHWGQTHPAAAISAIAGAVTLFIFFIASVFTRIHQQKEDARFEQDLSKIRQLVEAQRKSNGSSKASQHADITAFITGANSGIGFTLARTLASLGVHVLLGCRSASRANAARDLILAAQPNAKVTVVIVDVSNPKSVLRAVQALKEGGVIEGCEVPKVQHLDFLFLNAGIMPSDGNRWGIAMLATFACSLRFFFETGRAYPSSHHFVSNPEDEAGFGGAPSVFATHVLGHVLLANELVDLMKPITSKGEVLQPATPAWDIARGGRVIWTGSRAACAPFLNWEHLQPPTIPGDASGHVKLQASGWKHGESYGEAKYAVDLLNPALQRHLGVPCIVICPGAVETELTPAVMRIAVGMLAVFRAFFPGFNVLPIRGTHALIGAAAASSETLRSDVKYITWAGELVPATSGFWAVPEKDQEKMYSLCDSWLSVWKKLLK